MGLCGGHLAHPGAVAFPTPSALWYEHNLLNRREVAKEVLHGTRKGNSTFPPPVCRREVQDRHRRLLESFDQVART